MTSNSKHIKMNSHLFKKFKNETKVGDIENEIFDHDHVNRYITTQEFNRLTSKKFAARLEQAKLATSSDLNAVEQFAIKIGRKIQKQHFKNIFVYRLTLSILDLKKTTTLNILFFEIKSII